MTKLAALLLIAILPPTSKQPLESPHRKYPNGLEGWTLSTPMPDPREGTYPTTLVLAQNGRVIRRILGSPFLWKWKIQANGTQIAFRAGPLHFSEDCILVDIASGKQLARYDCYRASSIAKAPAWVKQLEASTEATAPH